MVGAEEGEETAEEQEDDEWKPEVAAKTILVEVAFATPSKQLIVPLIVPLGTTAYQAVVLSNIKDEFDEIDLEAMTMGIFSKLWDGKGRPTAKEYVLQVRDRVEIYRPLTIDPMQARLNRAETAKKKAAKHKAEQHPQTK